MKPFAKPANSPIPPINAAGPSIGGETAWPPAPIIVVPCRPPSKVGCEIKPPAIGGGPGVANLRVDAEPTYSPHASETGFELSIAVLLAWLFR
jgi:hypothetical protein